jgi:hypothetical protein
VQRTKTYEVVVDTATDTTNTYYKLLPADQSTAQATSSDVTLEIYRPSTATTTWQLWIRTSSSFTNTGALTWSAESYGDAVVTYAAALSPATSASGSAVTTPHPSNGLDTVAGNVGIGTDAPAATLDVRGTVLLQAGNAPVVSSLGTASKLTTAANASAPSSPATGDLWLVSDVAGTSDESLPKGRVNGITPIVANQGSITTTVDVTGGSFTHTLVAGRRYKFTANYRGFASTVAGDVARMLILLGGVTYGTIDTYCGIANVVTNSACPSIEVLCKSSPTAPQEIAPGSTVCKLQALRTTGTGTLTMAGAAAYPVLFFVEDIGT